MTWMDVAINILEKQILDSNSSDSLWRKLVSFLRQVMTDCVGPLAEE
jgi:hypothetical protein